MNAQAEAVREIKRKLRTSGKISVINSTDALALVEHSSELSLSITTPVGTKLQCKASFIGTHGQSLILIEVPEVSDDDLAYFFQEGFWVKVKAISPRGQGGVIHFRSQIVHNILEPIAMVGLSVPSTMELTQLRKEPRYDVNLIGITFAGKQKGACEIRDLSKGGCRFITPPLSQSFHLGDSLSIEVKGKNQQVLHKLVGKICNLQRSTHYAHYGLEFDEIGIESTKALLAKLKFNGTKLAFR